MRDGASEARVEGRFVVQGEEVVVARVLPRDGRSRAYVNGRLATATELAGIGARLVDLHGQHDHQSLLVAANQRALLDAYAGADAAEARARVRQTRADARLVDEEIAKLGGDERARAREADLLRFQITEIDNAAIRELDEVERLAAEEHLLSDADRCRAALGSAYRALHGDASDAIGIALHAVGAEDQWAALAVRVRALQADTEDLARELRHLSESIVADPSRLASVRERRLALRDLLRKYGDTLAAVVEYGDATRRRLDELEGRDARASELESKRLELSEMSAAAITRLREIRSAAAVPLARAIEEHLHGLALPKAAVVVAVDAAEPSDDGGDAVSFLLSPNPGEAPRPLARAASGGELSRAMLAVRLVLSEAPPTLVFDEVDAGIGGEAGVAVGSALAELGRHHQVLVVTHLAQVAAFADHQVHVSKHTSGGRTTAGATALEGDHRVRELSRMLGGVGDSSHARAHAEELLDVAAKAKDRPALRVVAP